MSKTHVVRRARTAPATPRAQASRIYLDAQFDLVDQMQWEDRAREENLFLTLEEAGLEESQVGDSFDCGGAYAHAQWFYDDDDSAFSVL
jgi:hypothetical protein